MNKDKISEEKLLEDFISLLQACRYTDRVQERLIERFKQGRVKYGYNDIMNIDCRAEIQQEEDDIIIYELIDLLKEKYATDLKANT